MHEPKHIELRIVKPRSQRLPPHIADALITRHCSSITSTAASSLLAALQALAIMHPDDPERAALVIAATDLDERITAKHASTLRVLAAMQGVIPPAA